MTFWNILGLAPGADRAAIRHAYAQKVKTVHPEEDPDGFAALHDAFNKALKAASAPTDEAAATTTLPKSPAPPAAPAMPPAPAAPNLPDLSRFYKEQQQAVDEFFATEQ